jgi:hypothetical protein
MQKSGWRRPSFSAQESKSENQLGASRHAGLLSGQIQCPFRAAFFVSTIDRLLINEA